MSLSDALAPDAADAEFAAMADPSTMTVAQLRKELNARGMDDTGLKSALQARLKAAIEAQNSGLKRKRDSTSAEVVPATIVYLRRGSLDILDAIAAELPEVFTEHILPKLSFEDTLALAQVNKAYRDTVWSVGGVQSLDDKIDAHINAKVFRVYCPMACAVEHGNLLAIRALLEAGVDVNAETTWKDGAFRALEVAAIKDQAAAAKALIEAGANVNHQDEQYDETALTIAANGGHAAVVAVFLNSGADVNLACNEQYHVENDSIYYHPEERGATALCKAALWGHDACVALLLQAGADIHKTNANGLTPMDLAKREAKRCEGFTPAKKELGKYKYEKVVTLLRQAAAMRR